ncbi:hypothetical protein CR157_00295 [Halomonas sp. LBP4]|nr:hypothetical protein CR157_00295 [Halomonas sp. LBP4]
MVPGQKGLEAQFPQGHLDAHEGAAAELELGPQAGGGVMRRAPGVMARLCLSGSATSALRRWKVLFVDNPLRSDIESSVNSSPFDRLRLAGHFLACPWLDNP